MAQVHPAPGPHSVRGTAGVPSAKQLMAAPRPVIGGLPTGGNHHGRSGPAAIPCSGSSTTPARPVRHPDHPARVEARAYREQLRGTFSRLAVQLTRGNGGTGAGSGDGDGGPWAPS